MSRSRAIVLGSLLAVAAVGGMGIHALRRDAAAARVAASVRQEHAARDQDIAFYAARTARDPRGAADRARLAALYLQRARETGNAEDYVRAETVARQSLALRGTHNARTWSSLASTLLAQHRFAEALAAAESLRALSPGDPAALALLGELQYETGAYDAARVTFDSLRAYADLLPVAPRLARWAELNGRTDEARSLLARAWLAAGRRSDLPREQVAWFALRVGDLELRHGRLGAAEAALREGLRLVPGDYRLLAALGRLELAKGHYRAAIRLGEDALASTPDPVTLGLLATAHQAAGDTTKAGEYARVMEVAAAAQSGSLHRSWGIFLLDHGRGVDVVVERAKAELTTRPDIYGYDLYAWACYHQGRYVEAGAAMDEALRLHTEDALLYYHAGMIARALGEDADATAALERALATNPTLGQVEVRSARAVLDSIAARRRAP